MAVSDNLFYVFDKADGAFLGKVKNEEMLGNDMHIEGMIKIDNNAFAIQYVRTYTKLQYQIGQSHRKIM